MAKSVIDELSQEQWTVKAALLCFGATVSVEILIQTADIGPIRA